MLLEDKYSAFLEYAHHISFKVHVIQFQLRRISAFEQLGWPDLRHYEQNHLCPAMLLSQKIKFPRGYSVFIVSFYWNMPVYTSTSTSKIGLSLKLRADALYK